MALKVYVPELYPGASPAQVPYPEWMDETKAKAALADSAKRKV